MLYGEGDPSGSPSFFGAPVSLGSRGARTHQTLVHFDIGLEDGADPLSNIMDYFGETMAWPGTGIAEGQFRSEPLFAHPNPFDPVTKITYGVREAACPFPVRGIPAGGRGTRLSPRQSKC